MTLEVSLEKRCKAAVEARGGMLWKLLPWPLKGIPDRLAILPGGVIWFVELKASGGRASALQLRWEIKLRRLGCNYLRTSSFEEFSESLWRGAGIR